MQFGTDGIRGVAGSELTPELVLALGRAAARVVVGGSARILVGRDTRLSGPMLQAAFSAGAASEGVEVVDLGVLPTPGVAAVAVERDAAAAIVSASHNPFADNGIKLLAPGGRKLTDEQESAVETELERLTRYEGSARPDLETRSGRSVGRVYEDRQALDWYCDRLVGVLEGRDLARMRVVLDCANGAAWSTAPRILAAAGAEVVEVLSAQPDGTNINDRCGSTDPSSLTRRWCATGLRSVWPSTAMPTE